LTEVPPSVPDEYKNAKRPVELIRIVPTMVVPTITRSTFVLAVGAAAMYR
jgi:hypothetical protein